MNFKELRIGNLIYFNGNHNHIGIVSGLKSNWMSEFVYDKPILNVKGKLSFWNWEGCEQICESCMNDFDMNTMQRDGDDNYFCKECADELFPVMQKEYEEMVAKGEIEPEED